LIIFSLYLPRAASSTRGIPYTCPTNLLDLFIVAGVAFEVPSPGWCGYIGTCCCPSELYHNGHVYPNTLPPNMLPPNMLPPNMLPPNILPPNILPPNMLPPNMLPPSFLSPSLPSDCFLVNLK